MTVKEIEAKMSQVLKSEVGVDVEITSRATGLWTVSGNALDVTKAVYFLTGHKLMEEVSRVHDDELEETYVYMRDNS